MGHTHSKYARKKNPNGHNAVPAAALLPGGIKLWHDCAGADVDICFVHGLAGNRDSTWTAEGQTAPWPELLLAPKLPGARLLAYGYDAAASSASGLHDHASNFLGDLVGDRRRAEAKRRPLVFVAPCLGGPVCEQAVLWSRNNPEEHLRDVFDSFKGIVFMGTPHRGTRMAGWARNSTNKTLLSLLREDDALLKVLRTQFALMMRELRESGRRVEAICFYEEFGTSGVGIIVTKESATVESFQAVPIHSDHRGMVRFASEEDDGLDRVFGELKRWKDDIRDSIAQSAHVNASQRR
ncbi:hypothetical protein F4820DRAFT_118408 [Hypoxylon rubiginosum]|uniref:Uncharacterized protein n=1 Tax=Hypoxylon rubiginosum TaxID=110542 RepID=A0ACB9YM73_9PEZI|nr:hypothetical protein F4820DRAFT_118408 [Hypoxylon rubiginosum]